MWRSERRIRPVGRDALRRLAAALAVCGAALAATGCAVAPPAPAGRPSEASLREWNGRFSVVVEAALPGGNHDTIVGRFALAARGAPGARALDLELVSPFGQTVATGRREPDGRAMLTLSDGRTLRAPSLDALLEQALGWPLPIERLPDWLDDRFETVVTRDAEGRVATAEDSGWRIEREPRRWTLRRPHEGTQLRVGLVLDR
ncbi:MAG: outer membrane lipoprotein LolB [Burkholderiales bacterium]|nr:outer membrane lipoprotein LolB [Burkholderiales bacterium]